MIQWIKCLFGKHDIRTLIGKGDENYYVYRHCRHCEFYDSTTVRIRGK